MGLTRAGYDPLTCLDFDFAVLEFGESFEAAREATEQVPAPPASKRRRPMTTKPKYTPEELQEFLSIPVEWTKPARAEDDPEVVEMAEDILSGKADWLLNPGGGDT